MDKEAIKVRILSLLKDRPLRNAEIRAFTDQETVGLSDFLKKWLPIFGSKATKTFFKVRAASKTFKNGLFLLKTDKLLNGNK